MICSKSVGKIRSFNKKTMDISPPQLLPFSSHACPLIPYNSRSTIEVNEKANKTIMFPRVPVDLRLMVAILEPTVPTPLTPLTSLTIAEYTICC